MYNGPHYPGKETLNMCGAMLTPAALLAALSLSELRWYISPAQYFSMQTWWLRELTTTKVEVKVEELMTPKSTSVTLFSIPVTIDDDIPSTTLQLKHKSEVIFEIQAAAIPFGF